MTEKSLIFSITLLNKSNITSTKTSVNTHRFEYFENLGALFKKKKSQFEYCSHSHCSVSVLFKPPDKADFQWRLRLKSFSAKNNQTGDVVSCRLVRFEF